MNTYIALSCLLAVAAATPQYLAYAPHVTTSQFHAQDELGQYSYGYSGGPSSKHEVRTADGVTRGSYSYLDGHGLVQSASYVADPLNGFRVAATNLPVGPAAAPVLAAPAAPIIAAPGVVTAAGTPLDTPEVVAAKYAHFAAHGEALARLGRKKRDIIAAGVVPAATYPAGVFPAAYHGLYAPRIVFDRAALYDDGSYKPNPFHDDGLYRGGRRRRSLAYAAVPAVVPSKAFAYSTVTPHVSAYHAPLAYSHWTSPLVHPLTVF